MTSTPPNPSDPPPAEVVHNVLSSLLSWPSVLLLLGLMFVPLALKAVSNLSYGRAYHARPEPSPHAARSDKTDVEPERASRQAHADQLTRVWADAKRVHQQVLDEVTAWEFDLSLSLEQSTPHTASKPRNAATETHKRRMVWL